MEVSKATANVLALLVTDGLEATANNAVGTVITTAIMLQLATTVLAIPLGLALNVHV